MITRNIIFLMVFGLVNVVRKLGEKEILAIAGDFNGHVKSNAEASVDQPGRYSFGVRNMERILDFCAAMNMLCSLQEEVNRLVTYESIVRTPSPTSPRRGVRGI